MKKSFLIGLVLALAAVLPAQAQTTVPASANVAWTLPTQDTKGAALTGTNALTSVNVYVSTSAIPDAPVGAAQVVLGATAQTTAYTLTAPANGTIHVRVSACNQFACGALSAEATKLVATGGLTPGVPTNVTITITITG